MPALGVESIAVKRIRDLAETLTKMDEDERFASTGWRRWWWPRSAHSLIDAKWMPPSLDRLHAVYRRADALAHWYQRKTYVTLWMLFFAFGLLLMVVEFVRSASPAASPSLEAPRWERIAMMVSAVAMVWAGLLHGYLEKRAYREHADRYPRMSNVFQHYRQVLESGLDAHAMHGAFFDLGKVALGESSEWVRLHRWRPLEPPRG